MTDFSGEITYRTARSGGKGGQNVNKVETQVEACWLPAKSACFTEDERARIVLALARRIHSDGVMTVRSSSTRSQLENKQIATSKMLQMVNDALVVDAERKPTKPTKASKEKRLFSKKIESEKKNRRRRPDMD